MATKNWGLQVPSKSTPLTPLATPFALLASSISDALTAVLSGSAKRGTSAQRDAFYGVPTTSAQQLALQGAQWFNTGTGLEETYYAAYSATNIRGASAAGWSAAGAIYNLSPNDAKLSVGTATTDFYAVRVGGLVTIHGSLSYDGGMPVNATTSLTSLPNGFRPLDNTRYYGIGYGSNGAQINITAAGNVTTSPSSGIGSVIYMDSPAFRVA